MGQQASLTLFKDYEGPGISTAGSINRFQRNEFLYFYLAETPQPKNQRSNLRRSGNPDIANNVMLQLSAEAELTE